MNTKDFTILKDKIEEKKRRKIQLETQQEEIRKNWKKQYGTDDPETIQAMITDKIEEIENLEKKEKILINKLEELVG